ncbi:hypothetical protein CAC42_6625 [Sphaceloma murrayae]|uniref:Zn(2)-C6 fungal-type domain-containing protein n=1 Tax=Sphaceloma murrayae TaxID=2082308 RepID=A0A2K1QGU7_9PEZI|nr:hypothetical protein CAC42_6625 [Sphaceloma murrayae]
MENGEDSGSREQNVSRRRQRTDTTETEEPQRPKRSRVSRACDQCRLSRDKCDGKSPCQTCTTSTRHCTYTTNPKKRGIQPGYIRTLESALALVFQRDPAAQRFLTNQLGSRGQLRRSVRDGHHSEELHAIWSGSNVCKQIECLLSGSPDEADTLIEDLQTGTPVQQTHSDMSVPATTMTGMLGVPDLSVDFFQAGTSFQQLYSGGLMVHESITTIDLPGDFWPLMDSYYAFIHNWLPISEKNDVLKTAYMYPIAGPDATVDTAGAHAELWAIVALASRQTGATVSEALPFVMLARKFIPDERGKFAKGHIRALILLSLLSLGEGDLLPAWFLIGFAARMLLHLRLHQRAAINDPRSRHLVLGCVTVENIIGTHLDLPVHLSSASGVHLDRLDEDGLEEWSPWQQPAQIAFSGGQSMAIREPGRCLSTFNALADTFMSRRTAVSKEAMLQRTPQQLHYGIMRCWSAYKKAQLPIKEYSQQVCSLVERFANCGGVASIPPTVGPLMRDIQTQGSVALGELAKDFVNRWGLRSIVPPGRLGDSDSRAQQAAASMSPATPHMYDAATQASMATDLMPQPQQLWQPPPPAQHYPNQRSFSFETQQPPLLDMSDMQNGTLASQDTPSGLSDGGALNSEFEAVFEEIAQLDSSRQMNDTQFMQNLGLGPESDLRAFFGADYQETDPLLAYLPFDTSGRQRAGSSNFPT